MINVVLIVTFTVVSLFLIGYFVANLTHLPFANERKISFSSFNINVLYGFVLSTIIVFVELSIGISPYNIRFLLFGKIIVALLFYVSKNFNIMHNLKLLQLIGIVVFLVSTPTIYLTQNTGIDKYWHTGNPDIIDAKCATEAFLISSNFEKDYLDNISKSAQFPKVGRPTARIVTIAGPAEFRFSDAAICDTARVYLEDSAKGQYVGLFVISLLTGVTGGLINYLILALIFMLLFFSSVKLIFQKVFSLGSSFASLYSLIVVTTHLYFVTFLNGHLGTQMIAPVLALFIAWLFNARDFKLFQNIEFVFILTFYLYLVYFFIIPFFYFTLIITFISLKKNLINSQLVDYIIQNHKYKSLIAIILGLILFISQLWRLTSEYRLQDTLKFRSWFSIKTNYGFLQYLGLFPGNTVEINSQQYINKNPLHPFISPFSDHLISSRHTIWIIILLFLCFVIYRFLKSFTNLIKSESFISIITLSVLLQYFFFFTFIGDSYYIYKILYIYQFLIIIFIVTFIHNLKQERVIQRLTKSLIIFISLSMIYINIYFNIQTFIGTKNLATNYLKLYPQIDAIPEEIWKDSILAMPESVDAYILAQILLEKRFINLNVQLKKPTYIIKQFNREEELNFFSGKESNDLYYKEYGELDLRFVYGGIWGLENTPGNYYRKIDANFSVIFLASNFDRILNLCGSRYRPEAEYKKNYLFYQDYNNKKIKIDFSQELPCIKIPIRGGTTRVPVNIEGFFPKDGVFDSRRTGYTLSKAYLEYES